MKEILMVLILCLLLFACSKNKPNAHLQIEVASYNTKVIAPQQDLVIQLKFTDKDGDISGGKFVYLPIHTNRRPLPPDLVLAPVASTIPQFPNATSGFLQLKLPWNYLNRSPVENDTFYFRFVAVDRAGNNSDTVNSDRVVVLH